MGDTLCVCMLGDVEYSGIGGGDRGEDDWRVSETAYASPARVHDGIRTARGSARACEPREPRKLQAALEAKRVG
jgi:hypothetical protein